MKYNRLENELLNEILYLISNEFKLVYKIHQVNLNGVQIRHQTGIEGLRGHELIITDKSELLSNGGFRTALVTKEMDLIQLKQTIIDLLETNVVHNEVTVGIDPGINTGIAILYHSQVIDTTVVYTISRLIQWIRPRMATLGKKQFTVKIGDGYPRERENYIIQLKRAFGNNVRLILVDESYSSIKYTNELTIHEQAAIIIAKRPDKYEL